jgi:hypothetical protein
VLGLTGVTGVRKWENFSPQMFSLSFFLASCPPHHTIVSAYFYAENNLYRHSVKNMSLAVNDYKPEWEM